METDRAIWSTDGVECWRNRASEVGVGLVDGGIDHGNNDIPTARKLVCLWQGNLLQRVLRQNRLRARRCRLRAITEVGLHQPNPRIPPQGGHHLRKGAVASHLVEFAATAEQRHELRLLALQAVPARKLNGKVVRLVLVQDDQNLARNRLRSGLGSCRVLRAMRHIAEIIAASRRLSGDGDDRRQVRPARLADALVRPATIAALEPCWACLAVLATEAGLKRLANLERGNRPPPKRFASARRCGGGDDEREDTERPQRLRR